MTEPETRVGGARRRRAPRRRVSVIGILGELLLTAGVLVLLFLGWKVGWNNMIHSNQQTRAAATQSQEWLQQAHNDPDQGETGSGDVTVRPDGTKDYGQPPVTAEVGFAEPFAVMYVPRFGSDWKRVVRESVDEQAVLNSYTAGIGHYPDTQMPGALGNFAVAGHDTGWGNSLINVSKLRVGDPIYVQTQAGWYTYRFRNFEYVQPNRVDVLSAVPTVAGATPKARYMTITTCNPPWHVQERLIAFSVFDSWQPLSAGPPKQIAAEVAAQK